MGTAHRQGGNDAAQHWLRCPNCGSVRLFIDTPATGLVFLRLNAATRGPFGTSDPAKPLPEAAPHLDEIHCTGCGWTGSPTELDGPTMEST